MKKIAVLGPSGTYSGVAVKKYISSNNLDLDIEYYDTFYRIMNNFKDYALLPIENSIAGYVFENLDYIIESDYKIVSQVKMPIKFALIGNKDAKEVYVQSKAYEECSEFLLENDFIIKRCNSNSEALRLYEENPNVAAVVPAHLINNHKVIEDNIENSKYNETRFFIIGKEMVIPEENDLAFSVVIISKNDKSGILYDILSDFNKYNLNLTSIVSRPLKTKIGEYKFFIESLIEKDNLKNIDRLMDNLNLKYEVKLLGIYNKLEENN